MLCIAVLIIERGINNPSFSLPHLLHLPLLGMAHSSNVIIHGSTFNSAQGDLHINNKDSGMHDFRFVQKSILINDPIKDFVT